MHTHTANDPLCQLHLPHCPGGPRSVPVLPGQSLLEAALAAGVPMDSSCRNGSCRACLSQLMSGAVAYRIEWPGLLAEEKSAGCVLPCVAVPAPTTSDSTPDITLHRVPFRAP
jgi:ferredoxin